MKKIILIITLFTPLLIAAQTQTCINYMQNDWPNSRYLEETVGADNIVIDTKTQLVWKKCGEGATGTTCTGTQSLLNFSGALAAADTINSTGGFAGHTDWRVPNIEELRTLVARNCTYPSINTTVFPNSNGGLYWSSTPNINHETQNWSIIFNFGETTTFETRTQTLKVRMVRGG